MINKAIFTTAILCAAMAGTARAADKINIDMDSFYAMQLPEARTYEEARLCVSIVYMNRMINAERAPDSPNTKRLTDQNTAAWAIWLPRAVDRYNQDETEKLSEDAFVEKVAKPNGTMLYHLWDDQAVPNSTLYFFDKYCLDHMADVTVTTAP